MNIAARFTYAALAASVALATPVAAQITFTGYTNACFYTGVVACVPETVSGVAIDVAGALIYTNSTFSVTTAGGSAPIGNAPAAPNINNLGSFTFPNDVPTFNFADQRFALSVFFTLPAGVVPPATTFTALLSGQVMGNTGGATITFDNPLQMFAFPGGSFTLKVTDVNLTNTVLGTTAAVTGNLIATVIPEPGTYLLMASGLAGLGIMYRRRRSA